MPSFSAARNSCIARHSDLLEKLQEIPTLPIVAVKVNELINDPTSSSVDIAEVLKKDQVLTAKILRLVNSSYYSIPGGVADVQRALAFLGFNTLAQLVLGVSVFSLFSGLDEEGFSLSEFWRHALGTAICSEIIAKKLELPRPEEAFTCGLLHDIGKLALYLIDRDRMVEILRRGKERQCGFVDVERELDFPGHAFLGEVMTTRWGLPYVIRLAVRYHHFDVSRMDSILKSAKPVIQIVRLANVLCLQCGIGHSGDFSEARANSDMLFPLGLPTSELPAIQDQLKQDMERAGAFLNAYR